MNCFNNMVLYNKYITYLFYIFISYVVIITKNKMFYKNNKKYIKDDNKIHKSLGSNDGVRNDDFENWWGQFEDIEKPF